MLVGELLPTLKTNFIASTLTRNDYKFRTTSIFKYMRVNFVNKQNTDPHIAGNYRTL